MSRSEARPLVTDNLEIREIRVIDVRADEADRRLDVDLELSFAPMRVIRRAHARVLQGVLAHAEKLRVQGFIEGEPVVVPSVEELDRQLDEAMAARLEEIRILSAIADAVFGWIG